MNIETTPETAQNNAEVAQTPLKEITTKHGRGAVVTALRGKDGVFFCLGYRSGKKFQISAKRLDWKKLHTNNLFAAAAIMARTGKVPVKG